VPSGDYEDWYIWMRLPSSARGKRVEFVVYEYRQHGVRMLGESAIRHGDTYAVLHSRHPMLFARRRAAWRRSRAPLA
jgi:hypothetical protein